MKKYFFILILVQPLFTEAQNADNLAKDHGTLMNKANIFFSTYKSDIDSRIKKTERLANSIGHDTSGAKSLIKVYQTDSAFYKMAIQKGDSLMTLLKYHDKLITESIEKGERSDKFLMENEDKTDKVKWIINYAKDIGKQVDKRLTVAGKELSEMRKSANKKKK